jgi:hypothetical protein
MRKIVDGCNISDVALSSVEGDVHRSIIKRKLLDSGSSIRQ